MAKMYEGMFVVDPTSASKDATKIPDFIHNILDKFKVKILQESRWAERSLAYSIKSHRRGNYYLAYFESTPENIAKITSECELNPNILRFVILALEPSEKAKVLGNIEKAAAPVEKKA